MSKKKVTIEEEQETAVQDESVNESKEQDENESTETESGAEEEQEEERDWEAEISEAKDKYLRLYSEFENYRRRTAKEKLDIIGTASKEVITDLLPVLDDFERAFKSYDENVEVKTVVEGMQLVIQKFNKALAAKGLKKMEIEPGTEFNDEFHEAISQIPAPEKKLEGKIVDVIENGYFLNDKVIRFARVVTAAKSS